MSATDDATIRPVHDPSRWLTLALAALAGAAVAALIGLLAAPSDPPVAAVWWRWLGAGAVLGAVVSLLGAALGMALRRAPRRAPRIEPQDRDPGALGAWLHVVSGTNRREVARGVFELAAHALAHRQRVLVIDAGAKLRLHERLGREARWGLAECLAAEMPLLGLVQYGGRPGLYLLAQGQARRGQRWGGLGRRLDDAHPHFGRVVLALDAGAPAELGDALRGRAFEAWWAGREAARSRARGVLSDRLGMSFSTIGLSAIPEPSLELLASREAALARRMPPPAPRVVAPPSPAPVRRILTEGPRVLECELRVQQRLRFLTWMRRVQSERQRDHERELVLS